MNGGTPGLSAGWAHLIFPEPRSIIAFSRSMNLPASLPTTLLFSNGLSLDLECAEGVFRGIGRVFLDGVVLRDARLPWTFYSESDTGERSVRFESFTLEGVTENADEVALTLRSVGHWMPRQQGADAMGEARISSRRLSAPEAVFTWRFRAITEIIQETEWRGVATSIEFDSGTAPLHWMMETATWEIGGRADGCTLIQQDVSTIRLEETVRADSEFSTIEKFFTDGWGGSYPMDMLPRGAGASVCDFQAKGATALCLFAERPGLTRARFEKFPDENVIHYLDRAYFPLSDRGATPERKILACRSPRELQRHDWRNLWLDCFTEVRRRILANYDFELEIPQPASGGHLWDSDLKRLGSKWPDAMERDFPEYARLGYKQLYLHGVWESITSDPNPPASGNICCPYSFRFADAFGGAERMKLLNDAAESAGLRLMQWFSFHLSQYAPIWKEHPDWILKEANGDPWDGNYRSLYSGRMRSEYGREFLRQITEVKKQTGISGIFWDSYQNLGVTCIDWGAADKAPQAEEIFRMQAELQRQGFLQRMEIVGIFGVSAVAMFGFRNDQFRRRLWDDFVEGDHAFALLDCSPAFFSGGENYLTEDRLSPERYFWMAAHRCVPSLSSNPWTSLHPKKPRFPGGEQAEAYGRVNRLYNASLPSMHRLRLQENGTHVVWLDGKGDPAVVWVFQDTEFSDAEKLVDLDDMQPAETSRLKAGKVYLVQSAVPSRGEGIAPHVAAFSGR
jgi:hypothetical protein